MRTEREVKCEEGAVRCRSNVQSGGWSVVAPTQVHPLHSPRRRAIESPMTILGATSPPQFPIGQSDYALLRRQGMTYVDKTMWVADVLGHSALIHVVPRPRRFGKTLNMSTLRYFVERTDYDRTALFEDTAIWNAENGRYRKHFQRYPTIYLSFKDLKESTWEDLWVGLRQLMATELERALGVLAAADFVPDGEADRQWLAKLDDDATPAHYSALLLKLTTWFEKATGERTIILIDEYDAPLHAAWQHGYWDTAVGFFRNFLSAGLKDNNHLHKAVLTGILKVAKEGIFSGLNHTDTATILTSHMSGRFGFTEDEVAALADVTGCPEQLPVMQQWYNGYQFGRVPPHTMYNPWSVLKFLDAPADGPQAFWKNTSDNGLIRALLMRHAAAVGPAIQSLLANEPVTQVVDENVAMPFLDRQPGAVFGLLFFSGYLTTISSQPTRRGIECQLRIPNEEVRSVFEDTFLAWMMADGPIAQSTEGPLHQLTTALLSGATSTFERELGALLKNGMSSFDFGHRPVEAVYQAFVIGLLLHMESTHRVRSNRESGFGRADVLVLPRTPGPGAVLELKIIDSDYDETREQALEKAIAQLQDRDYAAEVRAGGATQVYQYAAVFDGKRCWVRAV